MGDITLPAENAEVIAHILRKHGYGMQAGWIEPKPAPSLRDEVRRAIFDTEGDADHIVDTVLDVVKRHVEGLDMPAYCNTGAAHDVMIASRDAALALADTILGAES